MDLERKRLLVVIRRALLSATVLLATSALGTAAETMNHTMPANSTAPATDMANACPVDGCDVEITGVEKAGDELTITMKANYGPDMAKNHIHVWWGDTYTVQQVSNDAETKYKVKQGDWVPTDAYPTYTTDGAVSMAVRNGSKTICVSAADRDHNILDATKLNCVDISNLL